MNFMMSTPSHNNFQGLSNNKRTDIAKNYDLYKNIVCTDGDKQEIYMSKVTPDIGEGTSSLKVDNRNFSHLRNYK